MLMSLLLPDIYEDILTGPFTDRRPGCGLSIPYT